MDNTNLINALWKDIDEIDNMALRGVDDIHTIAVSLVVLSKAIYTLIEVIESKDKED